MSIVANTLPVITQCSIRHLYTAEGMEPSAKNACIDMAKTFERRRCNHHTLPEPLSAEECINSVVDPKDSGTNKNRYIVASQDGKIRAIMRRKAGVPLIYINRSVMIMEPMGQKTEEVREMEERGKVRAGLKGRRGQAPDSAPLKRKRSDEDEHGQGDDEPENGDHADITGKSDEKPAPKKTRKGPKGPNPLSIKKSKKKPTDAEVELEKQAVARAAKRDPQAAEKALDAHVAVSAAADEASDEPAKKKRRRKHKSAAEATTNEDATAQEALAAEA